MIVQEEWMAFETIVDFFLKYVTMNKNLPENEVIEIEAKLGEIKFTKEASSDFKNTLKQLSN